MFSNAYTTVEDGQFRAAQGTRTHHLKQLRLFSAAGPPTSREMDILGVLPKDEIWQLARNCYERPVHKAEKPCSRH